MIISIIGTGNVAAVIGRLCVQKGHTIKQVAGRNIEHAKLLADELHAEFLHIHENLSSGTDVIIIALSDMSLPDALNGMYYGDTVIAHTAGAVALDVLKNNGSNYGVFYPLQSLKKDIDHIPEIPFLLDANNDYTMSRLETLAHSLSNNVVKANDGDRLRLHTCAVIVNNFTNYLYGVAKDICEKEHVNFELLKPLIMETADRIHVNSPADVQTGPALRKDITTLDKHLRLLSNYPKLRTLYMRMTDYIMNP